MVTRALPGKNCEAAHPACRKRRLLGTNQRQSALLVVGLSVSNLHSRLVRNGLPLFPSLIQLGWEREPGSPYLHPKEEEG